MARLYLLYDTISQRISNPDKAGIKIGDGYLQLENLEIEKRLFTLVRTGILGAILVGDMDYYAFDYVKDGSKAGRKYIAFRVAPENQNTICMIIIKEGRNMISDDVRNTINAICSKLNGKLNSAKRKEPTYV